MTTMASLLATPVEVRKRVYTAESIKLQEVTLMSPLGGKKKKKIEPGTTIFHSFRKKLCKRFIEDQYAKTDDICKCGRKLVDHAKAVELEYEDLPWDSVKDTTYDVTDAFGEIEFHGAGNETRAKFVRLDDGSDMNSIWRLLLDEWKLGLPDILISIAGSAKNIYLPEKTREYIERGMWKIVNKKVAWIITAGTNSGVTKHIGRALHGALKRHDKSASSYCIGITPWGIVNEREALKVSNNNNDTVLYHLRSGLLSAQSLDNNHSHFLLVDNGTVDKYWTELEFRGDLEQYLRARIEQRKGMKNIALPVICLLIGGGAHAIRLARMALSHHRPIPVAVLTGSGKAASILAKAKTLSVGEDEVCDEEFLAEHQELKDFIQTVFYNKSEKETEQIYADVVKCIEKKKYITICDVENSTLDLDEFLVQSLVACYNDSAAQQLYVSLYWNSPETARQTILGDKHIFTLETLEDAMMYCLTNDMVEFAELLMDNGVSMSKFLTAGRLQTLYKERDRIGRGFVHTLLMDGFMHSISKIVGPEANGILYQIWPTISDRSESKTANEMVKNPFKQLFIWAVLNNMLDMATLMWKYGPDPLAKALIACKLFDIQVTFTQQNETTEEASEYFCRLKSTFAEWSVQLLEKCYSIDERLCKQLLTSELSNWGKTTCLTLAVSAAQEDFVSHVACQSLLTSVWYGKLKLKRFHSLKVVLCLLLPFLIPFLHFKSKQEITDEPEATVAGQDEGYIWEEEIIDIVDGDVEIDQREENHEEAGEIEIEKIKVAFDLPLDAEQSAIDEQTAAQSLPLRSRYYYFFKAPITKFWIHMGFYVAFLMLYSYVALVNLPPEPSAAEWLLFIWVLSLTSEEFRQFIECEAGDFTGKFNEWSSSKWNYLDLLALLVYYLAFVLRLFTATRLAANVLYGLDCMVWIIRILELFAVNKYMGPYVLMITKMVIDMLYFIFVMAIFLFAYGIARYSILEPYTEASWTLIKKVLYVPYFQIFGELFLESSKESTTVFGTKRYYKGEEELGVVLLNLYLLVANILLLNLLIAVFNNTYGQVQAKSKLIWRYQRYFLIMDYAKRPWLPAPFIILSNLWKLFSFCLCKRCNKRHRAGYRMLLKTELKSNDDALQLKLFEKGALTIHLRKEDVDENKEKLGISADEFLDGLSNLRTSLIDHVEGMRWFEVDQGKRLHDLDSKFVSKAITSGKMERRLSETERKPCMVPEDETINAESESEDTQLILSEEIFCEHVAEAVPTESFTYTKMASLRPQSQDSLWSTSVTREPVYPSQEEEFLSDDLQVSDANEILYCTPAKGKETMFSLVQSRKVPLRDEISSDKEQAMPDKPPPPISPDLHEDSFDFRLHERALMSPYVGSIVQRFKVLDSLVSWKKSYPDYDPPNYTSSIVLAAPSWADPPIHTGRFLFNAQDGPVDRRSYVALYDVADAKPRNPYGRTGLTGRGLLGRWGPNHAVKIAITRWLRDPSNIFHFEFVTVVKKRRGVGRSLPMEMIKEDQTLPRTIQAAFNPAYLDQQRIPRKEKKRVAEKLKALLSYPHIISRQYEDDPRNTDNAWVETLNLWIHDRDGDVLKYFLQSSVEKETGLTWTTFDSGSDLNSEDVKLLTKVQLMAAH